jgi:hypothetical protein
VELNEILANVLKEENRQRLLMQSLLKLIDKNKEQFFSADEINDAEEDWVGIMSNSRKDKEKDSSSLRNTGSAKSLKINTKPSQNGPPSPSEPSPSSRGASQSAKLPAPFSSGNSILNAGAGLHERCISVVSDQSAINVAVSAFMPSPRACFSFIHVAALLHPCYIVVAADALNRKDSFGSSVNSGKQPGMARMNRSASMVALTTGFAILGSDLDKKCDAGVQVDEKDEFGCTGFIAVSHVMFLGRS